MYIIRKRLDLLNLIKKRLLKLIILFYIQCFCAFYSTKEYFRRDVFMMPHLDNIVS